ncbi:MAG: hypothetical protein AAB625_02725 [Patescibacteria group bacterium]
MGARPVFLPNPCQPSRSTKKFETTSKEHRLTPPSRCTIRSSAFGLAKSSARNPPVKAEKENVQKFLMFCFVVFTTQKAQPVDSTRIVFLLSDCAIKKHNSFIVESTLNL